MNHRGRLAVLLAASLIAACAGSHAPASRDGSDESAAPPAPGAPTLVRTALPDGSDVRGIAWNGDRFVIVGASGVFEGRSRPTAWTSADGLTWVRWDGPACDGAFVSVVAFAGGFVAAAECAGAGRDAFAVATSPDGQAWNLASVDDQDLGDQGDGWVSDDIAAASAGLMLLVGENGRTHALRSPDGRSWRRVTDVDSIGASIYGGPSGYLVLGVVDGGGQGAWVSAEGVAWTAADLPDDVLGPPVGVPDGFLALGGRRDAWASRDGLAWVRRPMRPQGLERLVAWPGGVFGIATDPDLGAWWTGDAATWTEVANTVVDERPMHVAGAVVGGRRLVTVIEHETPNPDPEIMQVLPSETLVWLVPTGA